MNILEKINYNIKLKNLFSYKSILFTGSPLLNCNINLIIIDDKEKKIINEIQILNDNDYNLKSMRTNKTFLVLKNGYNFFNNEYNNKIIYLFPFNKNFVLNTKNFSGNIFTTLISYKMIENNDLNSLSRMNNITTLLFKILFNNKYNNIKFLDLINNNYVYYFIKNNLIENIYNYQYKIIDYETCNILIKILKIDIKINFVLLLILKFNTTIKENEVFELYKLIWDNLELFNSTNININLISKFINNENFNNIILSWFKYIEFCSDLIYLLNICNNINKFTDEDLIISSINKNKIIDKYINYNDYKNKLNIFKLILY